MTQMSNQARAEVGPCGCPGIEDLLQARFFRALCDPGRIRILARLARAAEPSTVTEIASCCPTNMSVVSRHLATLRDAGILAAEKRGKDRVHHGFQIYLSEEHI